MSVAILLSTYQGEKFLPQQLDSFEAQTHTSWQVWASDDGSTDNTLKILQDYQKKWGEERLKIVSGPGQGFVKNFTSLLLNADIQAPYYAYSDQDDIWAPNKLEKALAWLKTIPEHRPALYGTRTILVDENDQHMGLSPLFKRPPSFSNALVQCMAGGNTMVFNAASRDYLRTHTKLKTDIVSHDWWTYLLIAGRGGKVFYDSHPTTLYRQHHQNSVGSNAFLWGKCRRVQGLFNNTFRSFNERNIASLQSIKETFTKKNQERFHAFCQGRQSGFLRRVECFRRAGIYRRTVLGQAGLWLGAFLNKV